MEKLAGSTARTRFMRDIAITSWRPDSSGVAPPQ
jgi:hypothetical protein